MSEETDSTESGIADPVALGAAMGRASHAVDAELVAYLHDQRHHLHEQLRQLHLGLWEKSLGVLLRVATAVVGIAVASGFAFLIWDASQSNGLLIEPFSVPPDLAAKGLSGEVVAGQLLDHLTQMQNATASSRPAQSYASNWGNDLKVEIPDTGISIGEFQRFLRQWLGHDTRITGAVWHTPTGIVIAARSGGKVSTPVAGSEADLDDLIQQAAEQVYDSTQPYRYANYLDRNLYRPGAKLRIAEAEAIYKRLIYDPDPTERAWAWNGLGTIAYSAHGNVHEAIRYYHKALAVQPNLSIAFSALTSQESNLSHPEAALAAAQEYRRLREIESPTERARDAAAEPIAELVGDFAQGARLCIKASGLPNMQGVLNHDIFQDCAALALTRQHDGAATRAWIADMPEVEAPLNHGRRAINQLRIAAALEDWRTVSDTEAAAEKAFVTWMPGYDHDIIFKRVMRPLLALAKARLGDIAGGEALIATLPGDCYDCIRIHATIAALAGKPAQADGLFAGAVRAAPSIPFAYADWGRVLLARGQPGAAIGKFTLANQQGPHFADPIEMWGEALMTQNRSDLALSKFEEANKYAPSWGRLHLKWGEALVYAGRPDEAKQQFSIASGLEIAPAEKAELARMRVAHTNPG